MLEAREIFYLCCTFPYNSLCRIVQENLGIMVALFI
jgi:hypothetical protein